MQICVRTPFQAIQSFHSGVDVVDECQKCLELIFHLLNLLLQLLVLVLELLDNDLGFLVWLCGGDGQALPY